MRSLDGLKGNPNYSIFKILSSSLMFHVSLVLEFFLIPYIYNQDIYNVHTYFFPLKYFEIDKPESKSKFQNTKKVVSLRLDFQNGILII